MSRRLPLPVLLIVLALLPACGRKEGMQPGECADALDNDDDGLFDCDDPDCAGSSDCAGPEGDEAGECTDDIDNDGDGDVDCDDPDCAGHSSCDTGPDDTQHHDTNHHHDSHSDDTGHPSYDLEIDVVSYGYDSREWMYEVECIGWADAVTLYITQDTSSPWEEDHDLDNIDFDPEGRWDLWAIDLAVIDNWADQTDSVNTLFGNAISCPNPACENTMAWRIEAYEGSTVKDCVVWTGSDANVSVVMESGCREIYFW